MSKEVASGIGAEEGTCVVVNENKTALAHGVRAEETVGLVGRLVTCKGIEHINKYLQDTGSQASLCWRKELQIWEEVRPEQSNGVKL